MRSPGSRERKTRVAPTRRAVVNWLIPASKWSGRAERMVFRGVLQVGRDDLGPDHDVALAGRHALGHPRRARGVQDRREVDLGDASLDC